MHNTRPSDINFSPLFARLRFSWLHNHSHDQLHVWCIAIMVLSQSNTNYFHVAFGVPVPKMPKGCYNSNCFARAVIFPKLTKSCKQRGNVFDQFINTEEIPLLEFTIYSGSCEILYNFYSMYCGFFFRARKIKKKKQSSAKKPIQKQNN